jgi:hypothetical protein
MLPWVIEEWNNPDFRFPTLLAQKLGGFFVLKQRNSLAPQSILSNHFLKFAFKCEYSPRQFFMPSFLLSSIQAYVGLRVGVKRQTCFAYVAKSK